MLEVNQRNIKRLEKYSILTIPKQFNYAGYKAIIPNCFISKSGFSRLINFEDNQKIKIKKDDKSKMILIGDLKRGITQNNKVQ